MATHDHIRHPLARRIPPPATPPPVTGPSAHRAETVEERRFQPPRPEMFLVRTYQGKRLCGATETG